MIPKGINEMRQKMWLCHRCWQVFAHSPAWSYHAQFGFSDIEEAEESCTELEVGDAVPAGATVGNKECWSAGDELDPAEWTNIERNDLVWDNEASRFIGVVSHRDARTVEIEPPDSGTKQIKREEFTPDGRYRAIRL